MTSSIALFMALGGSSYAAISSGEGAPQPPSGQEPAVQPAAEGLPTEPAAELPQAPGDPVEPSPPVDPAPLEDQPGGEDESMPPEPPVEGAAEVGRSDEPSGEGRGGEGGGPPPWAPAHGWRCKQAGHAPGSREFHRCIASRKGERGRGGGD